MVIQLSFPAEITSFITIPVWHRMCETLSTKVTKRNKWHPKNESAICIIFETGDILKLIKKISNRTRLFTVKCIERSRLVTIALTTLGVIVKLFMISDMFDDRETRPITLTDTTDIDKEKSNILSRNSLKVMTLNAAHGRKDGRHQIFQKNTSIKSNLNDIATVLEQGNPDVIALQEADGPSAWSGNFDHVEYLARKAKYIYSVRGEHVKGKKLDYGTALLSNLPLNTPVSITFAPSPPTFSKGAVICSINWPGTDMKIDIVSLHLDFARKSVRRKQIDKLVEKLTQRERPLIIMGDFNCEWKDKKSTLGTLMNTLNLKAYRPEAKDMKTFPKTGKRLDWILISEELEFSTYNVFEDTMSDHLGVVSDLRIA